MKTPLIALVGAILLILAGCQDNSLEELSEIADLPADVSEDYDHVDTANSLEIDNHEPNRDTRLSWVLSSIQQSWAEVDNNPTGTHACCKFRVVSINLSRREFSGLIINWD